MVTWWSGKACRHPVTNGLGLVHPGEGLTAGGYHAHVRGQNLIQHLGLAFAEHLVVKAADDGFVGARHCSSS
jgi:hypothetical protein